MQDYFRKIDFVFYNEEKIKQAVIDERETSFKPELKNSSGLSDPTASKAIRNLTPLYSIKICGIVLKFPAPTIRRPSSRSTAFNFCPIKKSRSFAPALK